MRAIHAVAFIAFLVVTAPAQEPVPFPQTLEGTGHACKGRLRLTSNNLYWKAVFDTCKSPYSVVSHNGTTWLLQVKYSKTCGYDLIEISPGSEHPGEWIVEGLTNPKYPLGNLACAMYEVTPPHRRTSAGKVGSK